MRVLLALAVAAVALSGCAAEAPTEPVEVPSAAGRAVLSGAVADGGLRPVPGATVEIVGTGLEATADGDARFLLAVPVGDHVAEIRHPDFAPTRLPVTVQPEGTRGVVLQFSSAAPA